MNTIKNLCIPRKSVFDDGHNEDVLDLTDLIEDRIDGEAFFEETYITEGMRQLFEEAFKRFEGKSARGLIKLTQSMGGGKTHNMIALGLLARSPSLRKKVLGDEFTSFDKKVRVIAFTGRECDVPFGIWGYLAEQLGKREQLRDYYSPLRAPGQSTWINLLKGEPLLILLDELPPYLEYAKAVQVGNSDLSVVTVTALSNLFNALGQKELSNVCIVVSDLRATYESGSQLLQQSFRELEGEVKRHATDIEPVRSNSDDLFNILRKRLFEKLPDSEKINEVALEYKEEIAKVKQMGYTNVSPDEIYKGIKESYPFHPSIKHLFARFKENPGFQQTRGFIRLTRLMVKQMFRDNGVASNRYLINAFDMDLNDPEMFSMVKSINPDLTNAITHDIADNGKAVAEVMDSERGGEDIQEIAKLILVSSLANVVNAVKGLSLPEAIGYIARPGKDITSIKNGFEDFKTKAWYMYYTNEGLYLFKNIKNVNAEMITLVDSYDNETAKKQIRKILEDKFKPEVKDCYQKVMVFPAIDDITLDRDNITLILYEPNELGGGLQKDLKEFYENQRFKNRVMFLTGQRKSMDNLLKRAKEYKAIESILHRMKYEDKVADNDPQYRQAKDLFDKTQMNLLHAARETFITLYFPKRKGLESVDFKMAFSNNEYKGEDQIRKVLLDEMKFEDDIFSSLDKTDTFRKKLEARIFTQKKMRWVDILYRAAETTGWNWYPPKTLETLKSKAIEMDWWREEGDHIEKGPFPKPDTEVSVREIHRDDDTGEAILKITPIHGDEVYYEIGDDPTTASMKVENLDSFKTNELELRFICVDSKGEHKTGKPTIWRNKLDIKYRINYKGHLKYVEMKPVPEKGVEIKYTTDGSNPKEYGATYIEPFEVPEDCKLVLAVAVSNKYNIESKVIEIKIGDKGTKTPLIDRIDKNIPLITKKRVEFKKSSDTLKNLELFKKYGVKLKGVSIGVELEGGSNSDNWVSVDFGSDIELDAEYIEKHIDLVRKVFPENTTLNTSVIFKECYFKKGGDFIEWTKEAGINLDDYENDIQQ